jgi:hypothetical protein
MSGAMARWALLVSVLGVLTAAAACHHSVSDEASDAGDEGDGACSCDIVTSNSAQTTIACGQVICAEGSLSLCSEGSVILEGICGDGGQDLYDAGFDGPDGETCVTNCNGRLCGQINNCGTVCGCDPGVTCNDSVCGNGCLEQVGAVCLAGNEDPSTCCQQGYECAVKDSGASICCTQTSTSTFVGGLCQLSSDCCDYPTVTCNPGTGTCQ